MTSPAVKALLVVGAVTMLSTGVLSQTSSTGFCPTCYQTSSNFTEKYIQNMMNASSSHILLLSNTGPERCQRLNLTSANSYNYTYITEANVSSSLSNTYTVTPWSLGSPGQLRLGIVSGLIGTSPLMQQVLHPIIARDDLIVFVSCSQGLLITRSEQVLVFVPYPYSGSPSMQEIKDVLNSTQIPTFNILNEVNMNCTPGGTPPPTRVANNQPFNIFNMIAESLTIPSIFPTPTQPSSSPLEALSDNDLALASEPVETPVTRNDGEVLETADEVVTDEDSLVVDVEKGDDKLKVDVEGEKKDEQAEEENVEQKVQEVVDSEKKLQSMAAQRRSLR